jgi:hypothetical protein
MRVKRLSEFQQGHKPSGREEFLNHVHSSLRNVAEEAFDALKMKWCILLHTPSVPKCKAHKL